MAGHEETPRPVGRGKVLLRAVSRGLSLGLWRAWLTLMALAGGFLGWLLHYWLWAIVRG